jgi:hypothetical protein
MLPSIVVLAHHTSPRPSSASLRTAAQLPDRDASDAELEMSGKRAEDGMASGERESIETRGVAAARYQPRAWCDRTSIPRVIEV